MVDSFYTILLEATFFLTVRPTHTHTHTRARTHTSTGRSEERSVRGSSPKTRRDVFWKDAPKMYFMRLSYVGNSKYLYVLPYKELNK